ncbi:hypothetical protein HANVADRAFT_58902 [Hanseniaspora valbyensis NRRL Y-1626]|uniref:P-loop containing nucleoside triphosphate hydrolase protein n=1 Tax=Hanseniaspora valbyensis NRRL Y-1626 TaxID=766949 RepID=A0A1B7TFB5_9ASCO|nr:hypothetical protein HANVADRAFT_58902 [Hanseniaspora valbyensis NRRL Y-1626]
MDGNNNNNKNKIDLITEQIFQEVIQEYEKKLNENSPLFVVIGGVPGSGKTTITKRLQEQLSLYFKDKQNNNINDEETVRYVSKNNDTNIELLNRITDTITDNTTIPSQDLLHDIVYDTEVKNYKSYKILKYDDSGLPFYSIKSIGGDKTSIEIHLPAKTESNNKQSPVATVPMDGFHIPLEILAKYANPKEALFKRGHFETFDSKNYLNFIKLILQSSNEEIVVKYPGFNHEDKDPVQNAYQLKLTPQNELKICIFEGLYNLFNEENYGSSIIEEFEKNKKDHLSFFFDSDDKDQYNENNLLPVLI